MWTGHGTHGTPWDGMETSRDCTGLSRDAAHGTPRDGILQGAASTVHYGTGLTHHGIARDRVKPTRTYTVFLYGTRQAHL